MPLSRDVGRLVGSVAQWIELILLFARYGGPRAASQGQNGIFGHYGDRKFDMGASCQK